MLRRLEAGRNWLIERSSDIRTFIEGVTRPGPWLSDIAKDHCRAHLRANSTSRSLRYGPLRRILATIARHPLASLAMLILFYFGAVAATWLSPPVSWGPQFPPSAEDYFRDFQTINLALMGAQATLLGLVYPLVIALVSLLFQETAARGARLNVYFKETEATVVGGMALLFVAVIGVQSPLYGQVPVKAVATATILNILWFTANLVGLAFFVRSSLNFVRPSGRHRMLESYLANTAWPAQFLATVRANRLQGAQSYGYLSDPAEVGLGGLINRYGFDAPIARKVLRRPRVLVDVAFGRLNAVLRSQTRRAARGQTPAALTFSPSIDTNYPQGSVALARGTGALSAAEALMLNWAYRFGPPDKRDPSSLTQDLLSELVASAQTQFEVGNFDQFDARLREATELHVRLYELAMSPRPKDGAAFNYAAIEEGWTSLGMAWAAAYRALLHRAGDRIEREPRFFESLVYLPSRLHWRIGKTVPAEARGALFHLAAIPALALLDRAGQERADATPHGATAPAVFNVQGASGEKYKRFWINYVGGWESFGEALSAVTRDDEHLPGWDELRLLTDDLFRHLSDTALLTARAAQIGEKQAIGWTADMLMKWRTRTIRRLGNDRGGWSLHRPLLTLRHAKLVWNEIEAAPLSLHDEPKVPAGVFGAIMENAWFDTVVMTLSSLLAKCPEPVGGAIPDTGAARVSLALYQNQSFDPGASTHPQARLIETGTLLRSLLRRADRATGYGAEMDGITDGIDRLEGPNYVSGRVYGWSGSEDGIAFADPQIVLLASTVTLLPSRRRGVFEIGEDTRRLLLPTEDAGRRRILDHLRDFLRRAEAIDVPRASALLSLLLERVVDVPEAEARIAAVNEMLVACRAVIESERLVTLRDAVFDPDRIAALESCIAETAFTQADFPLTLFREVGRVARPLDRFTFRETGLRRGIYTLPQLEDPYSDGDDHLRQYYTPLVASRVLLDALQSHPSVRKSPRTPAGWWRAVKEGIEAVRSAGMTPLIILGDGNGPSWIADWKYDLSGASRPPDMQLERRAGLGDRYDFHLNEVPVYSDIGAQDATWVVAHEMFARVEFEVFGNGRMVRADFTVDATDPWKTSLAVEWGRAVTVAAAPHFKITHSSKAARA